MCKQLTILKILPLYFFSKLSIKIKKKVRETDSKKYRKLGNEHFKSGEYMQALKSYKNALKSDQKSIVLHSNVALTYFKLGKFEKCLEICALGLELDEKNCKLLYRRALAFLEVGKKFKAQKDLTNCLWFDSNCIEAKLKLAEILENLEDNERIFVKEFSNTQFENESLDNCHEIMFDIVN